MSRSSYLRAIQVRSSSVHGRGAFASSRVRSGQLIGNYTGRHIDDEQARLRNDGLTFLFALSEGGYIDGADGGNDTRFINHSCEPNCRAEEYWLAGSLQVRIKALRAITENEELLLDYSLIVDVSEQPSNCPCHCGAATCRRTMVSADVEYSPPCYWSVSTGRISTHSSAAATLEAEFPNAASE